MRLCRSVETIETCLANIDQYEKHLSAFVTVLRENALVQARVADDAARKGHWLGPLHGMPVVIKDNIDTQGVRTTRGSLVWADHIPSRDATVVRRLKQAGAIILGKTTLGELVFDIRSHNPITPIPQNPWQQGRSPGGSSGGSAAAVAANMTIGALGSDTGGSIRLPAANSGVCGLRPTHGVVPCTGAGAVSYQNDTIGPMAKNIVDLIAIFTAIVGKDNMDPYSVSSDYPDLFREANRGVKGLRIGIPSHFYFDGLSPDIERAVMSVAHELRSQGAELIDVNIPGAERTHEMASVLIYSDVAVYNRNLLEKDNQMTPRMYERMRRGLDYSATDYAEALHFKAVWQSMLRDVFNNVDLLLIPTSPTGALPNSDTADLHSLTARSAQFTYGGSLAGIPGLSIPCGFTDDSLPIGALLQAAWFNEGLLMRAGQAYQNQSHWHRKTPHE